MTIDGFLTFMTLLIGALTFMPSVMRLRLRVAMHLWVIWTLIGAVAVLYFEFFHVLAQPCPSQIRWLQASCPHLEMVLPGEQTSPTGITPQQAAFIVVLVWMGFALAGIMRARIHVRSMPSLARLIERLADSRQIPDLLDMLEPNLERIDACANRRLWHQRLYDAVSPKQWLMSYEMNAFVAGITGEAMLAKPPLWPRIKVCGRHCIKLLLPTGARMQGSAEDILRILLCRRDVLDHVVAYRPQFGAKLLRLRHHRVGDFVDRFLEALIAKPDSALYDEVEASQNLIHCGYLLAPDAAVLHAMLDDAEIASRLSVYRPILETVISSLNPVNGSAYGDSLNVPWEAAFAEHGRWRDPVYVTIRFYDIMVHAAACQGITSHMWVYYMHHLSRALVMQYDDTGPDVDRNAEWPIRSSHMLYSIVDALKEWIKLAAKLPSDSPHRAIDDLSIDRGTTNIPKASAVTLGDVMKAVIMSDKIDYRFQSYLFEVAIRWIGEWSATGDLGWVRAVTIAAIAKGGTVDGGNAYREALCELYRGWIDPG